MPEKLAITDYSNHSRRRNLLLRLRNIPPGFLLVLFLIFMPLTEIPCLASTPVPCLRKMPSNAGFLAVDGEGKILAKQHANDKFVPASTLKILTALSALHYLGPGYRFRTDFFLTPAHDLVVKGYGDPFLISEVWQDIANHLAGKIHSFRNLLLDDTFFAPGLSIPGQGLSTNPYDAPPGALCANFNTVFFIRDSQGHILSAESQTPMIPFAQEKIQALGKKSGRYTFFHDHRQALLYAGELFSFFLEKKGVLRKGTICPGTTNPDDTLIYAYYSALTLQDVIKEMFAFSNNFVANQLLLSTGAAVYGAPATLQKGIRAVLDYATKNLRLKDVAIVEGSGISRKNRISPQDMLTVLRRFRPYRDLLPREGPFLYKTGTLKGIRTRAGYIEKRDGKTGYIVLFLKNGRQDTDVL
ncbi:MAG: D-alanyl-D-alanine carboxypeptidase, partial [Deltaproteobacteria bacterium]|nr:D-alanyl-D-alanine carboxypeptidase [Deltaproteobacteria bacterium]